MKLPGTIEERLGVLVADHVRLHLETEIAALEDSGVRVDCDLAGATSCIRLDLPER